MERIISNNIEIANLAHDCWDQSCHKTHQLSPHNCTCYGLLLTINHQTQRNLF